MCFLNTLKVLSEGMMGNKDLLRCWLETGSWGAVGAALGRAERGGGCRRGGRQHGGGARSGPPVSSLSRRWTGERRQALRVCFWPAKCEMPRWGCPTNYRQVSHAQSTLPVATSTHEGLGSHHSVLKKNWKPRTFLEGPSESWPWGTLRSGEKWMRQV